ncbi:hypothetical protein N9H94_02865 [Akkermansiaceae bacterium]|nr:hypothetical protein [Akkermansiaceae bacterium]
MRSRLSDLLEGVGSGTCSIVYSTCSIDPEENGDLVRDVAIAHSHLMMTESQQILPFTHGTDGAFAALLLDQRDK